MQRLALISNHLCHYVFKNIQPLEFEQVGDLKGKVMVITGGSRGIGHDLAVRAAKDGAKVAILAKTVEAYQHMPGTIFTAAKDIEEAGGEALPVQVDIRYEDQVIQAVDQVVQKWGRIDVVVNNASAIKLRNFQEITMKEFDLMNQINARGSFLVCKYCIPHMLKSENPHIISFSPQLNIATDFYKYAIGYVIAKQAMSQVAIGLSQTYAGVIGINTLWPKFTVATAAIEHNLGSKNEFKHCMKTSIMVDSAYKIITSDCKVINGMQLFDDEVLGDVDLKQYQVDPKTDLKDLISDFFV